MPGLASCSSSMRGMMWSFQAARMNWLKTCSWMMSRGWISLRQTAWMASNSSASAMRRVLAVRSWTRAFWEERALPSGVRGPVA
jgi:hypothetical protein